MNGAISWLLDYQLTPCCNVGSFAPFYNGRMWWAEPDLEHLAIAMRKAYEGQFIENIGVNARKHIIENFNNEKSAEAFMKAIEEVR